MSIESLSSGAAEYRYPASALRADYLRAGAGMALTALPLVYAHDSAWILAIFGGLFLLFLTFGVRTWIRQATAVRLSDAGVATVGPSTRSLAWSDLTGLRLRFFATRRDRSEGWMQLTLRAGPRRIDVDSHLDGFEAVAEQAARAAQANGVELSPVTRSNFGALGIELADGAESPDLTAGPAWRT